MDVISTPLEMQQTSAAWRLEGRTIAFVPTMGALHAGHMSLIEAAKRHPKFKEGRDRLVVSIFVNPLQFGPREDLSRYPRPLEADKTKCRSAGIDCLFLPDPMSMYPDGFQTEIQVTQLSQGLCGTSRPGHFNGVATVVCKLFNIVEPQLACFGEKDFQQLAVIRRMVTDLNLPLEIVPVPTLREKDGLAMSSRNLYLSTDDRKQALILYDSLQWAGSQFQSGNTDCVAMKQEIITQISSQRETRVDYVEFVHNDSLTSIYTYLPGKTRLVIAAFIGKEKPVRLIDNQLY